MNMNLDNETIFKLKNYMTGEMDESERISFEKEINSSEELQEYLEINNQIDNFETGEWIALNTDFSKLKEKKNYFNTPEIKEFSNKLDIFDKSFHNKEKVSFRRNIFYITAIAASFLAFFYFSRFNEPSLENIYSKYNTWSEIPSFSVKGTNNSNEELQIIESLFIKKQYNKIIENYGRFDMSDIDNANPNQFIYLGLAYLETNQYEEALSSFNLLIQSNAIDAHKGYWYSAMVYLKQGNREKALSILKTIVNNKSYYKHNDAIKILHTLKD